MEAAPTDKNQSGIGVNGETSRQNQVYYTSNPPPYYVQSNAIGQPPSVFPAEVAVLNASPNVVIVSQQSPVVPIRQSFGCHYFCSCMIFWFCGFLFGAIAFILALIGSGKASEDDASGARTMATASTVINVIGFLVGCAAWGVLIWWLVTYVVYCPWSVYGACYTIRSCAISSVYCYPSYNGIYWNGCCYYN